MFLFNEKVIWLSEENWRSYSKKKLITHFISKTLQTSNETVLNVCCLALHEVSCPKVMSRMSKKKKRVIFSICNFVMSLSIQYAI